MKLLTIVTLLSILFTPLAPAWADEPIIVQPQKPLCAMPPFAYHTLTPEETATLKRLNFHDNVTIPLPDGWNGIFIRTKEGVRISQLNGPRGEVLYPVTTPLRDDLLQNAQGLLVAFGPGPAVTVEAVNAYGALVQGILAPSLTSAANNFYNLATIRATLANIEKKQQILQRISTTLGLPSPEQQLLRELNIEHEIWSIVAAAVRGLDPSVGTYDGAAIYRTVKLLIARSVLESLLTTIGEYTQNPYAVATHTFKNGVPYAPLKVQQAMAQKYAQALRDLNAGMMSNDILTVRQRLATPHQQEVRPLQQFIKHYEKTHPELGIERKVILSFLQNLLEEFALWPYAQEQGVLDVIRAVANDPWSIFINYPAVEEQLKKDEQQFKILATLDTLLKKELHPLLMGPGQDMKEFLAKVHKEANTNITRINKAKAKLGGNKAAPSKPVAPTTSTPQTPSFEDQIRTTFFAFLDGNNPAGARVLTMVQHHTLQELRQGIIGLINNRLLGSRPFNEVEQLLNKASSSPADITNIKWTGTTYTKRINPELATLIGYGWRVTTHQRDITDTASETFDAEEALRNEWEIRFAVKGLRALRRLENDPRLTYAQLFDTIIQEIETELRTFGASLWNVRFQDKLYNALLLSNLKTSPVLGIREPDGLLPALDDLMLFVRNTVALDAHNTNPLQLRWQQLLNNIQPRTERIIDLTEKLKTLIKVWEAQQKK